MNSEDYLSSISPSGTSGANRQECNDQFVILNNHALYEMCPTYMPMCDYINQASHKPSYTS